ncbi:LytTr DNA-binding domain-containing protein [Ekhidna lutea]|uniref:LytTr DNA-binding domain-containing protein n=1 Tax=Ekhidna lutea TaxID=447679 RepID=A0A239M6E4_EKHLU|nr:LytTR family DNA-binding domain-containing protein [Ekhidna lutea]SNT38030.1 LytTr DNA-binding domain-containing protein [Ekhidna lutea]
MNRRTSILLIAFIIGLIFFDAFQQKYYLETFDLSPTGNVSFLELLGNHLIRWFFWIVVNIPFGLIVWNLYFKKKPPTNKDWMLISICIFVNALFSIALISTHSIIAQGVPFIEFWEFFEFFIFQKGLTFALASSMVTLLLFNHSKLKTISKQEVEIKNLKKTTSDLKEVLHQDETPHLNIKTGYKLKPVPLEDIIWIQSDDYCVKIHTAETTFTLRQSLKALEDKLSPFRFIRIHRTALVNLDYLDQINYETAKVRLLNETEVPYSKTGYKSLKEKMRDISA